jgi:tetratricopeptide (TPR) repeat protein
LGVSATAVALTAVNSEGLDRAQAALLADDSAASTVDSTLLAGLTSVTLGYERLRRQVSSRDLVGPVYSHLEMLDRLLRASLLPAQRTVLTANLSQVLSLMSWLHYFDKSDKAQGRRWLRKSIAAAMESDDPRLEVLGLIRAAEQSTYDQRGHRSVELLQSAHQIASAHASPRAQSWVLSAQAEAYSTFGEADQSMRLLERAQARLDLAEPQQEAAERSSWVEFWDQSRLDSYMGACHMRLEQPVKARAALINALDRAETSAVKYRSIYLMDLATTYAQEDEVEQACSLAERAFDLAGPMHYGTTLERMQTLRGRLRRSSRDGRVRQLEDKVRSAAAESRV